MSRPIILTLATTVAAGAIACSKGEARPVPFTAVPGGEIHAYTNGSGIRAEASTGSGSPTGQSALEGKPAPNPMGRIPILEYHLIEQREWRWGRNYDRFRKDLQTLYDRGYRPVTVSQMVDRKMNLAPGLSPVVFVFDDASPGQFSYVERNGKLEVDPNSAMGIWLDFNRKHTDWTKSAVFCVLPAASAGHAFFGDKGIDGQKTAWRFPKLQFLAQNGFEICNHTLWHANLGKYSDGFVQEQIARGELAIDSAVPGYKVRTFALPLGIWPKNKPLAWKGEWTDPKSHKTLRYHYEAVLEVAGGPARSPYDPKFDPHHLPRVELFGGALEQTLDALDKPGVNGRYVAGGANHP
ncbi:MAG TPA: polysaccharide deacetylase family protein [Gemmatimonadaceae bacterium]|jgi:hypothetical protein|nr:polysaccharide deacetylase family protein [Gemmatimonadaceae bacterium]